MILELLKGKIDLNKPLPIFKYNNFFGEHSSYNQPRNEISLVDFLEENKTQLQLKGKELIFEIIRDKSLKATITSKPN